MDLAFTKVSESTYHCPAKSYPGESYVLSVMSTGEIYCTCQGSVRRGPDTCKHAKGLRKQLDAKVT